MGEDMSKLEKMVRHPNVYNRKKAIEKVENVKDKEVTLILNKGLNDKNYYIRLISLINIKNLKNNIDENRIDKDQIKNLLSDDDWEVREAACRIYGEICNDDNVDILLDKLDEEKSFIKKSAVKSFFDMVYNDKKVKDDLIKNMCLENRKKWAKLLINFGNYNQIEFLCEYFILGDSEIKEEIIEEFEKTQNENITKVLEDKLTKENKVIASILKERNETSVFDFEKKISYVTYHIMMGNWEKLVKKSYLKPLQKKVDECEDENIKRKIKNCILKIIETNQGDSKTKTQKFVEDLQRT